MLVDSHTHLEILDDLKGTLSRAKAAGIGKIITIGTSIESSKRTIEIANTFSDQKLQIYATCGLHPKDLKEELKQLHYNDILKSLKSWVLSSGKVVAIGECGLDYYLEQETENRKPETSGKEKELQRELFKAQVELASELKLPLVVHCRNGWDEIFDLLISNRKWLKADGVFHSWTGNWQAAKHALDLGFYISFSGIVTFKNARDIQEVAKKVPIDRILVETDSPFLAPEPLRFAPFEKSQDRQGKLGRGKTNEPKNVRITAQFLADLRNLPFDKIAEATTENAESIFGIKSI